MTEHLPKTLRDIAMWCKNDGALSEEVDLLAAAAEIERLTRLYADKCSAYSEASDAYEKAMDEIERLTAENERLRTALGRLVNDSMYKDHPEASQMAIDALCAHQQKALHCDLCGERLAGRDHSKCDAAYTDTLR